MTAQRADRPDDLDRDDNLDMRYISARIPDELFEQVKAAAERDRRTVTAWLTIAIEKSLADQEQREKGERES